MSLLDTIKDFIGNLIPVGFEDDARGYMDDLDEDLHDKFEEAKASVPPQL